MQLKLRIHLYFQRTYVIKPANGRKKEYHRRVSPIVRIEMCIRDRGSGSPLNGDFVNVAFITKDDFLSKMCIRDRIKRVFVDELLTLLPQLRIIGFIFLPHIRVYTIIYNDYACVIPYPKSVSYTHLDVYKRQRRNHRLFCSRTNHRPGNAAKYPAQRAWYSFSSRPYTWHCACLLYTSPLSVFHRNYSACLFPQADRQRILARLY